MWRVVLGACVFVGLVWRVRNENWNDWYETGRDGRLFIYTHDNKLKELIETDRRDKANRSFWPRRRLV